MGELGRFIRASLLDPVPLRYEETAGAVRRRRIVTAVTLLVGAALLSVSINLPPGDDRFYLFTVLLALTWTVGAFASGPLHLGRAHTRSGSYARPVVQPVILAVALLALFVVGAVLIAQVPLLRDSVEQVLDHARFASLPVVVLITLVNGLAEELFFRGAVFAAAPARFQVTASTAAYVAATAASANLMLTFAAVLLGALVGLQRRVTGGVLGPMITHVLWSLGMLLVLPPLFTALA